MGLFGNLKSDGLEAQGDRLGGFAVFDSDAYPGTIKLAYGMQSSGGATGVELVVEMDDGKEYKETVYVTNRNGENFFLNKTDKSKKVPLPGFTIINDICLMTTDKPLNEQAEEEKVVKVYDYDAKKEVPKSVPVLIDLLGKRIVLGIKKTNEDKSKKDAAGVYQPTGETQFRNNIDKVFHDPSLITVAEATTAAEKNEAPVANFHKSWVDRNKGTVKDNSTGAAGAAGKPGKPGSAPAAGGGDAAPRKSLFGG